MKGQATVFCCITSTTFKPHHYYSPTRHQGQKTTYYFFGLTFLILKHILLYFLLNSIIQLCIYTIHFPISKSLTLHIQFPIQGKRDSLSEGHYSENNQIYLSNIQALAPRYLAISSFPLQSFSSSHHLLGIPRLMDNQQPSLVVLLSSNLANNYRKTYQGTTQCLQYFHLLKLPLNIYDSLKESKCITLQEIPFMETSFNPHT